MKPISESGLLTDANLKGYWNLDKFDSTVTNKLLLHFNDVDTATSTIDMFSKTITFVGTAQMDTAQYKFGGSSLLLDGNSDCVTTASHADFQSGSGDFTVDCWVRFASVVGTQFIYWYGSDGNYKNGTYMYQSGGKIYGGQRDAGGSNESYVASDVTVTTDTWYHVSFTRGSGTIYVGVNGVVKSGTGTYYPGGAPPDSPIVSIGAQYGAGSRTNYFNGWIDEFRYNNGAAFYTSNYTVPTTPYSVGSDDYILGGYHGVQTGVSFALTTGVFNQGGSFNGSSSKIVIPDSANLKPTGNFTVGAWCNTSTNANQTIFQTFAYPSKYAGIMLYVSQSGSYYYTMLSGKNTGTVEATDFGVVRSTTAISGTWQFVVGTWDGSYLRLYVNGALACTPVAWANAASYHTTNYVRIGAECDSGTDSTFFNGSMDDVFLFNRALTADEISSIYKSNSGLFFLV